MGWLLKEAKATVVFVGLEAPVAAKLTPQLVKMGVEDPGAFVVHQVQTLADCRNVLDTVEVTGICVQLASFEPLDCIAFISDIRQTHPLISFCLVGSKEFLKKMPGYHVNWRNRFQHYFQLASDSSGEDFEQNAGILRDLFIADIVKNKALGQYQTTPGVVIRLKAPIPYGFWINLIFLCLAAIVGGAIAPAIERAFPKNSEPAHATPIQSEADRRN